MDAKKLQKVVMPNAGNFFDGSGANLDLYSGKSLNAKP